MSLLDHHRGRELTESQREWIRVREYLMAQRHELGRQAVDLYADTLKVADTPLLSRPDWLPPPVTFLISPGEGLQATGHGMTCCPCR